MHIKIPDVNEVVAYITETEKRKLQARCVTIAVLFTVCLFFGAYLISASQVEEARSYGTYNSDTWKTFPCIIMTFLSCIGNVIWFMVTCFKIADIKEKENEA
jgi:hypothetical protein